MSLNSLISGQNLLRQSLRAAHLTDWGRVSSMCWLLWYQKLLLWPTSMLLHDVNRHEHGKKSSWWTLIISYTWILTQSWGRARGKGGKSREQKQQGAHQVSARVDGRWWWLGSSRNIQTGFTRYVNRMQLDILINKLVIKIKAMDDLVVLK